MVFLRKLCCLGGLIGIIWYPTTRVSGAETGGNSTSGSNSIPNPFDLNLNPDYASDAVVPMQRAPLMGALDHFGLARPLDQAGINIYGDIEGSYTYNAADPHSFDEGPQHKIELRMFDHHSDQLILQRIDLFIDRFVNYHHATKWDVGGLIEFQYGHDGAMMHSNGLLDYNLKYIPAGPGGPAHFANTYLANEHSPYYQPDLTEAFVDLAAPVGNGLRVRAGKFATIMGYESCDPVHNQAIQFFSRSFILTFGIPMYQTGAYVTYDISDNITANAGFSRGWEQALKDNNDSLDFLGSVNFILNDNFVDYVAASEGAEQPDDNSHYRTVLENIVYFTPDPRGPWNFALDMLAGWEDNQVKQYFSFFPPAPGSVSTGAPVGNTCWYGIASLWRLSRQQHSPDQGSR